MAQTPWKLLRRATTDGEESAGETVVERLELAHGPLSRCVGLLFRQSLPPGNGLLLVPCSSVHTFWMRFAIDVVMLDRLGRVTEVRPNVRPWRLVLPRMACHAVLELPGGSCQLAAGDQLQLAAATQAALPGALEFLRSPAETLQ